ncbi:MAG: uracil-DNA glycosylase [Saprospiraceae bacterium]|nr:uracil-DNA glycosylase [Saprospiraceae bacterium]
MNPDSVQINPEWRQALKSAFDNPNFDSLTTFLKNEKGSGKTIYPPGPLIFNAYNTINPLEVKVVIIGQDPYHNDGEAMGLSFSVPKGIKVPPSLKNIYKELDNDVDFTIPNHGDLTEWAKQGVFLLNAVLTVEKNNPGSHKNKGWENFTDFTIQYLSEKQENLVFLLWGNYAKNKKTLIDVSKHLILEAAHPSPLAGNAFQGCKHFSQTNRFLIDHYKQAINWQI